MDESTPVARLHIAAFPDELAHAEAALIDVRRGAKTALPAREVVAGAVGIAISGGGIRSATFALGVFQAMVKSEFLRSVDYISTVSGGGYFGGFLGALYARSKQDREKTWQAVVEAFDDNAPTMRYLRENGRFLAPAGSVDLLFAGAVMLRNWLALQTALWSVLLPVVCGLRYANTWLMGLLRVPVASYQKLLDGLTWPIAMTGAQPEAWWCSLVDTLGRTSVFYGPALAIWVLFALPFGWSYWLVGAPDSGTGLLRWLWLRVGVRESPAFLPPKLSTIPVFAAMLALSNIATANQRPTVALITLWVTAFAFTIQAISRNFSAPYRVNTRSVWEFTWRFCVLFVVYVVACRLIVDASCFITTSVAQAGSWQLTVAIFLCGLIALSAVATATRFFPPYDLAISGVDLERIEGMEADLHGRYNTSVWLKTTLSFGLFFLLLAMFDHGARAGREYLVSTGAALNKQPWSWGAISAATTAAVALWQKLVRNSSFLTKNKNLTLPLSLLAYAVGIGAFCSVLFVITSLIYFVPHDAVGTVAGASLVAAIALGFSRQILNNSTLLPFYEAQVTRTFLGASNPARTSPSDSAEESAKKASVSCLISGDDLAPRDYYHPQGPYQRGGPLHLINTTINETVDGRSSVEQTDRKGLGLTLGPAGLSAGVRHHVLHNWQEDTCRTLDSTSRYRVFDYPAVTTPDETGPRAEALPAHGDRSRVFTAEKLTIGRWLGISGAAFSTGLGYRTNLGLSLLMGLANVRLGYWWNAGAQRKKSWKRFLGAIFWVQTYVFKELLARFPGTATSLWYLSDGGHFENMGAYELIRRRLQTIVVLDAEADPAFTFEGLGNLVRKARIDLGAEIEFVSDAELEEQSSPIWRELSATLRGKLGSLASLRPDTAKNAGIHAAIARVRYVERAENERPALLVYVKPTLSKSVPTDVAQYHAGHLDFPHQTTGDQFFDEAQWESYRKLGASVGRQIFGRKSGFRCAERPTI